MQVSASTVVIISSTNPMNWDMICNRHRIQMHTGPCTLHALILILFFISATVGSIVGVNNAQIAAMLGADVVLVANGGLGSAYDELTLNRIICQHYGVRIAGVVINRVIQEKYDQTKYFMTKVLKETWGVPLLGCIPDRPFLGCPALMDLETIFNTKLINGEKHRFRHYNMNDINLVTTSLTTFLENLRNKPSRTLYVCHVTRDDLILGFMAEYQRRQAKEKDSFEAALLVCGRGGKYQLSKEVKDMVMGLDCAPVSE